MNKKRVYSLISLTLLVASLALVFSVFTSSSKKTYDDKQIIVNQLTYLSLERFHYHPKKFDDQLSKEIYKELLKNFDNGKRFFLQSDIETFSKFETLIDDLVKLNNLEFFELMKSTYTKRLKQVEGFYKDILSKPFDFTKDEYIEFDPDKLDYPADSSDLRERWRKILKYETMIKLASYLDEQEQAKKRNDTTYEYKTFDQLEEKARNEVVKQYEDWFSFMNQMKDEDWFSLYINSITAPFDPHTQYFPPKTEEDFQIYMSGKLEGIGATLQYKNGEIRVVKIIPGGAAWREGELEVGDVILKVAQDGEPPVSIVGMRIDDAVRLIRGPKGTKVHLTVRKVDGTIKEITIVRDVVIIEDTYARSLILSKPGSKYKFGYIYIPSFYADFQNPNGRRVYKDVRKELMKLKDQKIDGLIIDLRNNGGGSLDDVIKMVGLFIKSGPVVQVRNRAGKVKVLRDNNDSVYYDGPLLVMVNEFSASASEIFAAAIQDYNRGVIFGPEHTHGKGTVQNILNYDDFVKYDYLKPLGALKITIQKFYRINGGSTQLKGVTSDIIVPTPFMYVKTGEREEDYPLPWDQIEPAKYKKYKPKYNLEKLRKRSEQRIEQDSVYAIIKQRAKFMKQQQDQMVVPLNIDEYRNMVKQRRQQNKAFNRIRKAKKNIDISFLVDDQKKFQTDTLAQVRYEDWKKNVQKDLYLPEALNVLTDMIK